MTKHTPGPWEVEVHSYTYSIVRDVSPFITEDVASVRRDGPQDSANARLISAAPELLEALETILTLRSELWADPDGPTYAELVRFSNDVVSLARPGIEKATGKGV